MDSTKRSHPPANGALAYSMRSTTAPRDDEAAMQTLLRNRATEGFASSAYWGCTGDVPPREPDDVVGHNPYRFKDEINRKLVPIPQQATSFPVTADYPQGGTHKLKDGALSGETGPGLNANQARQLMATRGLNGTGDAAASGKPRFLYLQTTNQRAPGQLDDTVLQVLRDGQKLEDDLARRMAELEGEPLASERPDPYRLTSDEHCDMTDIDPSSWRVWERDPEDPDGRVDVYRTRYNNVEKEGPKRRARTTDTLRREHDADPVALRSTLDASRREAVPSGYQPWSASEWMSTTHREHARYDVDDAATMNDRNATMPIRNVNYQLAPQHEMSVTSRDTRQLSRNRGQWATTNSDAYQDRSDQADVDRSRAVRGVWDIVNGVYTIDHHYHHPRNDTSTGESYTPAQIVPGQYATMSQKPLHARNELA